MVTGPNLIKHMGQNEKYSMKDLSIFQNFILFMFWLYFSFNELQNVNPLQSLSLSIPRAAFLGGEGGGEVGAYTLDHLNLRIQTRH